MGEIGNFCRCACALHRVSQQYSGCRNGAATLSKSVSSLRRSCSGIGKPSRRPRPPWPPNAANRMLLARWLSPSHHMFLIRKERRRELGPPGLIPHGAAAKHTLYWSLNPYALLLNISRSLRPPPPHGCCSGDGQARVFPPISR